MVKANPFLNTFWWAFQSSVWKPNCGHWVVSQSFGKLQGCPEELVGEEHSTGLCGKRKTHRRKFQQVQQKSEKGYSLQRNDYGESWESEKARLNVGRFQIVLLFFFTTCTFVVFPLLTLHPLSQFMGVPTFRTASGRMLWWFGGTLNGFELFFVCAPFLADFFRGSCLCTCACGTTHARR